MGLAALGRLPRAWQVDAARASWWAVRLRRTGVIYAATGAGKTLAVALFLASLQEAPGLVDVVVVPTQSLVEQTARALSAIGLPVGRWYQHAREDARIMVACRPSLAGLAEHLAAAGVRARLVIVDECHGVGADSRCLQAIQALEAANPALRRIGYTATPTREDGIGMGGMWPDGFLLAYTMRDAIRDGVILEPEVIVPSPDDAAIVGTDDVDAVGLYMLRRYAVGPAVVDAENVAECERYADFLRVNGVSAEAIHYQSTDPDGVVERLRTGRIQVAVHVRMLSEGVDMPWLGTIAIRGKTGSVVRWIQTAGRVVRTHPGKEGARILDIRNQWAAFGGARTFSVDDLECELERDGAEQFADLPSTPGKIRRMREKDPVQFVAQLHSWISLVHYRLAERGVVSRIEWVPDWMAAGYSPKQAETIRRWREERRTSPARHLDAEHRERFVAALECQTLTPLARRMLLDIGFALNKAGAAHFREHGTAWMGARGIETGGEA